MKFLAYLFVCICICADLVAQPLFKDEFNYGGAAANIVGLGSSPWLQLGTTVSSNPVQYDPTSSLSFPGFVSSGGKINLGTSGQDIVAPLPEAYNSGTLYYGLLVNFSSAEAQGDYFMHFTQSTTTTNFNGRVFVRKSGSNIQFGLMKANGGATPYNSTLFDLNTTYAVILKYTFVDGATNNDYVDLFVYDASTGVPSIPPSTSLMQVATNSDASSLAAISLRQGTAGASAAMSVDNVYFSTSWYNLVSVLPVKLLDYSAALTADKKITHTWKIDNDGSLKSFNLEKSIDGNSFKTIDAIPSNGKKGIQNYSYESSQIEETAYYRLKILQNNGEIKYSSTLLIRQSLASRFKIYPNPAFSNQMISIQHEKAEQNATLRILNSGGQTVLYRMLSLGAINTNFTLRNLPAGDYIVIFRSGNLTSNGILKVN